ncbi:MAG: transporter substrate-binding domain-containing protein, partial [Candidatus Hydromicrobium sp.]|nr:transporter substrate-binding domain-containing protein [Candidatus Hydromicrobium sp.]
MFLNFTRKKKKVLLFFINISLSAVIILSISPLTSCGVTGTVDNNSLTGDEIKITNDSKKLMVGSDTTYKPFEFKEDGNVEGFDIDIAGE